MSVWQTLNAIKGVEIMKRMLMMVVVFLIIGVNLYADPVARFIELASWSGRTGRDIIAAGGEFVSENHLPFGGSIRVYRILREYGGYVFTVTGNQISIVTFHNVFVPAGTGIQNHPGAGRIRYRTENEFRADAERFRHLVQSLNARLISNTNTNVDGRTNSVRYEVTLQGGYDVRLMLVTHIDNREQRHFGYYHISITFPR